MNVFTQIAVVIVSLLALVGATLITIVSAWKPNDHTQETETWEGGVLVRTRRAQVASPVLTWIQMFLAIEVTGLVIVVVIHVA